MGAIVLTSRVRLKPSKSMSRVLCRFGPMIPALLITRSIARPLMMLAAMGQRIPIGDVDAVDDLNRAASR